jgi:hypothetical protein
MPDCGKNSPKHRISWPWSTYSRPVIHNGHLDKFLWILKFFNFCSKSKCVSLRFYQKMLDCGKNSSKLRISWLWRPYFGLVIYNGHIYIYIYEFWIFKNFDSKCKCVSLQVYRKNVRLCDKKWSKVRIS